MGADARSCCDSQNFTQVKQHPPKRTQATGPTSPRETWGSMGLPLAFPTLPSEWCFTISPVPGLPGQEKHLQVKRDRTTRHLHSLAAQAKCQGVGIPRAAGCLDFSQGIFGKCQNRNLLTKTCDISIRAWPRDQVQTLLFQ